MNKKGQSILSEYVMIFFVVIAALVAMTIFVQRGLEARVHDVRNYMVQSVKNACDANCLNAAGGSISHEYEPYYTVALSDVTQNIQDNVGIMPGNAAETGSLDLRTVNESTNSLSTSTQLPPGCAGQNGQNICSGVL